MAKITIDGSEHDFPAGMNLFDAVAQARGEALPHFCYHEGLSIAGVCRMCQVEVEGVPKLLIACNSKVQEGMVVHTKTERVQTTVKQILNFHLLHHPVDCPVCDQAGECSLQDFYMKHGLYDAAIDIDEKLAKGKVKPIGAHVMLDAERCVLCTRCTRFTSEVTKTHELGIFNRGNHSEIDVAPGKTLDNAYSLNTVDLCPVGALTSRDFRFKRRVWWLESTDSVCNGCATGCNMQIHHSDGKAYRFKPRVNRDVNDWWMCDHGRLLYHDIQVEERLEGPLVRESESGLALPGNWNTAYAVIESKLSELGEARKIYLVGSPHCTLEELYAFSTLLPAAGAEFLGYRLAGSERGIADDLLLDGDLTPNAKGAARLGLREFDATALAAAAGRNAILIVLNNDLAALSDDCAKALTGFGLVVHIRDRADRTARLAHVTLAGRNFAEKAGTFVNRKGRAQAIERALEGPKNARDELRIIRELGSLLGHSPVWKDAADVRREMATRHDGLAALAGAIPTAGVDLDARQADEVGHG